MISHQKKYIFLQKYIYPPKFNNPNIEVFISYLENLNKESEFDIYEEYISETYENRDISLPLDDSTIQSQSNSHEERLPQPNQQQTPT